MPVSKTDFVRGLQCEKMLWLDAHAPHLKIIPPEVQQRLDAGNEFGDNAMGIFGEFTETTAYRPDGRLHFAAMIQKTQQLLTDGEKVICEGAFSWYGNFCAADILKKEGAGYALYEVKNTYAVREEFLVDLGFQRLIIRKCGVPLTRCYLILRGDTPPQNTAPENVSNHTEEGATEEATFIEHTGMRYKIIDVTKQVRQYDKTASDRIFELGKLKRKDAPLPPIEVGEHCEAPYRCWYYEHCHANAPNLPKQE
ncbi:MAG: hypothetical protein IJD33_02675 [Clostridia bacterium]|nr:hypothetical protein [Clostridia bacterium]